MTQTIGAKQDKTASLDLLEQILRRFILNGVYHNVASAIDEHVAWLQKNPADLNVNCKLETVPELQLTRVILEYSFLPIPPLKSN